MKFALQTISFPKETEWDTVFKEIKSMGYEGVETHASFEYYGGHKRLAGMLKREGLLMPCKWGDDPLSFTVEKGKPMGLEFLAFRGSPKDVEKLSKELEITLLLHNHVGDRGPGSGEVETISQCVEYLSSRPQMMMCPDTGHFAAVGENPKTAILEMADRVKYVHLKDWKPKYGGAEYWKGFCELGEGIVDISGVLSALEEIGYSGWITVEQDYTERDPLVSAKMSREYLKSLGY